jgi:hypothetical protein
MKKVLGLLAVAGLLATVSPATQAAAMGPVSAAMKPANGAGLATEAPVILAHWHHWHRWHHRHWHRWHRWHHRHWHRHW